MHHCLFLRSHRIRLYLDKRERGTNGESEFSGTSPVAAFGGKRRPSPGHFSERRRVVAFREGQIIYPEKVWEDLARPSPPQKADSYLNGLWIIPLRQGGGMITGYFPLQEDPVFFPRWILFPAVDYCPTTACVLLWRRTFFFS
jgi:hypothetical protein